MAASTARLLNRVPVIVVCGATGTGKSKLALEIAVKYGGEVISADSMQIYQGLDIITNKVTAEERRLVRHHLLDCASPLTRWTVVDFQRQSLPIIEKLLAEGRVPVIVGGTHYYIESLLWQVLIDDESQHQEGELVYEAEQRLKGSSPSNNSESESEELDFEKLIFTDEGVRHVATDRLHKFLQQIDPTMANTLHPNNRRKIIRSLQAWQQHGRPHSELLLQQRHAEGGSALGGPLRYPRRTIVFSLQCQQDVLDRRLDERVDDMMERGLLDELGEFHRLYNRPRLDGNSEADYSKGIFQSIGFKEFHDYLTLPAEPSVGREEALARGIQALKVTTRRYARKQIKWIKRRFLQITDRQVPPVYGLDTTDPSLWNGQVRDLAFSIIDWFSSKDDDRSNNDSNGPVEPMALDSSSISVGREEQTSFRCDQCGVVTIGRHQWLAHINSSRHRKLAKRIAKKKQQQQFQPD